MQNIKYNFNFLFQDVPNHMAPNFLINLPKVLLMLILAGSITHCSTQSTIENNQNGLTHVTEDFKKKCRTSAKKTVTADDPSIRVSFLEPKTRADGSPLTNLAKTTIYYDIGSGLVKVKDIPASNLNGGGKILEIVKIPLKNAKTINATICVTATDVEGREG